MKAILSRAFAARIDDISVFTARALTAFIMKVAGDAALMCEATNIDTLAQLIAKAMKDLQWRTDARERGLAHNDGFSWDRCTAQTLIAYRKTLESR
ncbi:hypothetical protein [Pseudomonas sp. PvP001]|uniref:hypothetical protein n=1 Tax=Pseudomonas sp. PvP001 TaxID=3158559 RepID=UPI0033952ACA